MPGSSFGATDMNCFGLVHQEKAVHFHRLWKRIFVSAKDAEHLPLLLGNTMGFAFKICARSARSSLLPCVDNSSRHVKSRVSGSFRAHLAYCKDRKCTDFGIGVFCQSQPCEQVWPSISPPDRCRKQYFAVSEVLQQSALLCLKGARAVAQGLAGLPGRDSLCRSMAWTARNSAMGHIGRVVRQKCLPSCLLLKITMQISPVRSTLAGSKIGQRDHESDVQLTASLATRLTRLDMLRSLTGRGLETGVTPHVH